MAGAVLAMARSAEPVNVESSKSVLLTRFGSVVGDTTLAVLVTTPWTFAATNTVMSTVAYAPEGSGIASGVVRSSTRSQVTAVAPTAAGQFHTPVTPPMPSTPPTEVADTNVRPAGRLSVIRTVGAASDGPTLSTRSR